MKHHATRLRFLLISLLGLVAGCASPDRGAPLPQQRWSAAESQLLTITNAERTKHGMPRPLRSHSTLHHAAATHSREMLRQGYFSHESPTPGRRTPMERYLAALKEGGGRRPMSLSVGENIFWMESSRDLDARAFAAHAHRGFMESKGHRENLLRSDWTDAGVGIIKQRSSKGHWIWYVTVLFKK